jgi:hypothetical protein
MPTVDPRDAELAACHALCRSGKFETGQGGCAAICMSVLGSSRGGPHGCPHAGQVHSGLAKAVLAARPEPLAGSGVAGELERLAAKATPGPWEVDTLKSEGEYGSGPDTTVGYEVSAIYNAKGEALFDALNSDAITVHEEYPDEDGYSLAYDEVSDANAKLIVALRNNLPTILQSLRAHPAPDQSAHCSGEVVEVVAEAIWRSNWQRSRGPDGTWDSFAGDYPSAAVIYRIYATAAIAALSAPRPDEGVILALREARSQIDYLHGRLGSETGSGNATLAKIDAALSHLTTPEKRP